MAARKNKPTDQPAIVNRRARHDYLIEETLEAGIVLTGSEVKSLRAGGASIAEGYVRAQASPPGLTLHGVHIQEYPPAAGRQHDPTRVRRLLAHKREIRRLADATRVKGVTIVPLRIYFTRGRAKVEIGLARGKRRSDKRDSIETREARREIDRALSRRRR
ncbi:MAG: SsrA-binding protein SmpB [Planctomycetota bacterium]|nr:MAG: SsrA-binding protein SmpB [Planctomycetota bacterium]